MGGRAGVVREVAGEGRGGVCIGEGEVRLIPGDVAVEIAGVERTRVRVGVGVGVEASPKFGFELEVTRGRGLMGVVVDVEVDWVDISLDTAAAGTGTEGRRLVFDTIDGVARGLGPEFELELLRLLRFLAVNLCGVDVELKVEISFWLRLTGAEIRRAAEVLFAKPGATLGIGIDDNDRRFAVELAVLRLLPTVDIPAKQSSL